MVKAKDRRAASVRIGLRPPQAKNPPEGVTPSVWRRVLTGKGAIASAVVAALLAATVPLLVTFIKDRINEPFHASAEEFSTNEYTMVLPQVLTADEIANRTPQDFLDDLKSGTATKAGFEAVKLTLQGNNSHTIVITDIRAHVIAKSPAISGTLFDGAPEGEVAAVKVGVELGGLNQSVREVGPNQVFLAPLFVKSSYTLKNDETSTFEILAHASHGNYAWNIEVDSLVDGARQSRYVDGADGPFRLSSLSTSYGVVAMVDSKDSYSSAEFCEKYHSTLCSDSAR
jgi:hypothetical protein